MRRCFGGSSHGQKPRRLAEYRETADTAKPHDSRLSDSVDPINNGDNSNRVFFFQKFFKTDKTFVSILRKQSEHEKIKDSQKSFTKRFFLRLLSRTVFVCARDCVEDK